MQGGIRACEGHGIDELAVAVRAKLGESFDKLLTPARLELKDPIECLSFASTQFLEKAISLGAPRGSELAIPG
jgi:hypothetical protein